MRWIKFISTIILSSALIAAFGLHSIEVTHEHNPATHTHQQQSGSSDFSIDEYFHGIEQKFFLAILLTLLVVGFFVLQKLWPHGDYLSRVIVRSIQILKIDYVYGETNFLTCLFRKGILNPKLH